MREHMEDNFFAKYYNLTLRYLSFRQRSEKEIRDYLHKKQIQESLIEIIITKLKEHRFLNDEEFTKTWVESRIRFKPRSLRMIERELVQKGISKEIIELVIHNSQFTIQNDKKMAKRLIDKKLPRIKGTKKEIYQKLVRFLVQKGFDWNVIKQSIDPNLIGVDEVLNE